MPRNRIDQPKFSYHTVSGQARVSLDNRTIYLGPYDAPETKARYHALIAVYLKNGKRLPEETP